MDYFSFLPYETIQCIFSYLDIVLAVRRVSRVSKLWRMLSLDRHLWDYLDFTRGDLGRELSDITFRKSIELCSKVKGINMSRTHITSRGVDIIVKSCPDLVCVDFSYCSRLRSCSDFESLLSLPHLRSVNLIGTWKLNEDNLKYIDAFLQRPLKLGVSIDLFARGDSGFSGQQEDDLICKLLKLSWIDLHANQSFATRFLNHPSLPCFASSLVSLEIGSRCVTSAFTEVPAQIGCLTSLTSLSIVAHELKTLPVEFANLSKLKALTITSSREGSFREIGDEITRLPSLTMLNLSSNKVHSIPPTISRLSNLTKLNMSGNDIMELPYEIGEVCTTPRTAIVSIVISQDKHILFASIDLQYFIVACFEAFEFESQQVIHTASYNGKPI